MIRQDIPQWFRTYLDVYGVLNITISIPWIFTAPYGGLIVLIPIMMLMTGVSVLFKKRWGILPILFLVLIVSAFFILIVIPFGFGYEAYGISAAYSTLLIVQWFTAITYWRHIVRRPSAT